MKRMMLSICLLLIALPGMAAIIHVPANYGTIQAAVTAAAAGDQIIVAAGTYTEQVSVTKTLTFTGNNQGISAGATPGVRVAETIVIGGFYIHTAANFTDIDGFTIEQGYNNGSHQTGVAVGSATNVTIRNNIIIDCGMVPAVVVQSDGIEVGYNSDNLTIENNEIHNNWRGVYLNPSDGITVTGNAIHANSGVGVGIGSSGQSNLSITGNEIYNHTVEGWGIDTVGANVVAENNTFLNSGTDIAHYSGLNIDASPNWWGDTDPSDDVVGDVTVYPCWTDASMTTLYAPVHNVTADTYFGTIQDAIDAAVAGDVIEIEPGTYAENVEVVGIADLTLEASGMPRPMLTGGLKLDSVSGLTLNELEISGQTATHNSIVRIFGTVTDLTVTDCLFDGETVSGRHGFSGGSLEGDITVTGSEFKNVLGWALFESRSGSGGDGSPMGSVVFSGNHVHHCNGTVVFRGDSSAPTTSVLISGNTWDTIGGNGAEQGSQWAAFEVNRAVEVDIYDNSVSGVLMGVGGEGQAAQIWTITDLDLHNNAFTDNYQGIWAAHDIATGVIHDNRISGCTDFAIQRSGTGITLIDASGNDFGTTDQATLASKLIGPVDYTPWLGGGTELFPGFAGDFSILYVDDESPQSGVTGLIQEGIDLVSGSTINILNGTYTGPNTITSGITLTGESEAGVIVEGTAGAPVTDVHTFLINAPGQDVTLENMTIRYGHFGVLSYVGNVDVLHCTLYHNGRTDGGTGVPGTPTQAAMATFWANYSLNGGAILIANSAASEIAYCSVYENDRGIRYHDSANGDIHDNVCHHNIQSGIYLASSDYTPANGCTDTEVYNNDVYGNMNNGLLSIGGKNNDFIDNNIYDNWNAGCQMWFVGENDIVDNTFTGNNLYPFNGQGVSGDAYGGVVLDDGLGIQAGSTYICKIHGNVIDDSGIGAQGQKVGVHVKDAVAGYLIDIQDNIFVSHEIDLLVNSQPLTTVANYNYFSGTAYGILNNAGPIVDGTYNFWGAADGPSSVGPGSGVHVSIDVNYAPFMTGNVVFTPDPQTISLADPGASDGVVCEYLGGGTGLLYGYSIDVTWDSGVITAAPANFAKPDNGPFASAQLFMVTAITGGVRIDAALGGVTPGIASGELFKATYTAVGTPDYATSALTFTLNNFRDSDNQPLTGFAGDDGLYIVDLVGPVVSGTAIVNDTLGHTDDYVKNTDGVTITATVTDGGAMLIGDIEADLTGFGGGGAVNPDTYAANVATWTLAGVTCTPADGTVTVTVSADDGAGNSGSDSDTITSDNTAPTAVADFACAPAHNEIDCAWTDASGNDIHYLRTEIMQAAWGDYPNYATAAPGYPGVGTAKWSGTGGSVTLTYLADGSERDIMYLQAYAVDIVLLYGPAATSAQDRATNYWLGDVSETGVGYGTYDGLVNITDVTALGTYYGQVPIPVAGDPVDVGPTDDGSRVGIPLPDDAVDFEDLMIFSMNYGVVAPLPIFQQNATEEPRFTWRMIEENVWALVLTEPCLDLKGLNLRSNLSEITVLDIQPGELCGSQAGQVFLQNIDANGLDAGLALLGTDLNFIGSGEMLRVTFSESVSALAVEVLARSSANQPLTAEMESTDTADAVPMVYRLAQNYPNPFNPTTSISFDLPEAQDVKLAVFGPDGRRIVTLVNESMPAGFHAVTWNGRDSGGTRMASGIYFYRIEAGPLQQTSKMLMLK